MTKEEARKVLQELWRNERADYCSLEVREAIDRAIRELKRPSGHWIKTIGENGVTSAARCSECGFGDNRYMLFRYCPNCGADMRGGRE